MFEKKDEEYLIRRLSRNEVVLFLGAGFSMMARNALNETLPVGRKFSEKLWNFLGTPGDYSDHNTALQSMYQAVLSSNKPYREIETILEDNFLVKEVPDIYNNLTIPFWYKIYTVNIDDLLDKIYAPTGVQELQVLKFPKDEYKERDQTLLKLQAVFLHGKLKCRPNEVIFSRTQYASTTLDHQPLYAQFVHDYSTLPTIFIGTALDEPIFDQYIAARQSRTGEIPENRPRSFIIDPYISPIQENIYRTLYNIEPIKATTEDFLKWLGSIDSLIPDYDDTLKIVLPSLTTLLASDKFKESFRESVNDFAQSFSKIIITSKYVNKSKAFLLGTSPRWADIYFNLDAPRLISPTIFNHVEVLFDSPSELGSIVILGSAGSGKSTVLRRVCFDLAKNGRSIYFSNSETIPSVTNLMTTLQMLKEKVVLAFDNADLILKQLVPMIEQLTKLPFPPVIILASRTNVFDRESNRCEPIINLKEFSMSNLERQEIVDVILILEKNNLLGYLKGMPQDNRIKEFEYRAKKQILVAMREATNGRDFDEIIKSEFDQIATSEAKLLCLCTALTTDAGFTISRQDFVSFSNDAPATVLDYLERTLKDIIIKTGPKADKLLLRHRAIAEFMIENCATIDMVKDAYIRVLSSLANEINDFKSNNRKFVLYREIINHYTIYKRFSKNIDKAREVYESLSQYFNKDFQFWLQYGSLECEGNGGNLQLAENYLNQAYSMKPKNPYVNNALANLYYRKATQTTSSTESIDLKNQADSILITMMTDRYVDDPYTYYIYGKGFYEWALHWDGNNREFLRNHFSEIQKVTKQATELYPGNKKLRLLNDTIFKAILMTAVNSNNTKYPVLFSDTETN